MIERSIVLYLHSLFSLALLLLLSTLSANIGALLGVTIPLAAHTEELPYYAFAVLVMIFGLVKDRNIWKNEFKLCPKWLRCTSLTIAVYGMVSAFVWLLLFKSNDSSVALQLCVSSIFLAFEAISFCILYVVLWCKEVSNFERRARVRTSLVMLALFIAIAAATRMGIFSHQARQE